MPETTYTFEQSLARLDEIVKILESGEAELEESIKLFEEGTALAHRCSKLLDEAQMKVSLLMQGPDGEPVEEEFIHEAL